ncbi:MAG TPA: GatB/YqeY domain-containing protein [Candidatus Saccharimonadales bacterium]|nr:GatB/YqeY domain-containing protein [Candidatus Saccharimonadales bacterium]
MSELIDKIDQDLKGAMLSGDKKLVLVLKGIKNSIQYAKVEKGMGSELSDEALMQILQKESKKRAEAIKIYEQAGDAGRAGAEEYEKTVIDGYLPEPLSEKEVEKLAEDSIKELGASGPQDMGKVIASVREKSDGRADGSTVARIVKGKLGL